ncbi:hypothetical protein [Streptococcus suis]|uniref:hypothetical protein n=1 Tax=Streptococcus suis TaxID=1307 RepID=UPI0003FCE9C1|nr:hypothetical protein [Streptococcus suis]
MDSYWSGCLTLTIQPEKDIAKRDIVLAFDLPNAVYDKLVKESNYQVIRMSADINHQYVGPIQRMKITSISVNLRDLL